MSQSKYKAGFGGDILGQEILNLHDHYNYTVLLYCMMIPIDCKITIFFYKQCIPFQRKNSYQKSFLMCAQLLITRKSTSQYASYSLADYQPITQRYKKRTAWRASLQSTLSAPPAINQNSGCAALSKCMTTLYFQQLQTL